MLVALVLASSTEAGLQLPTTHPTPLNCTAYCKYYVECMCGQPLPSKAECLACVGEHKASFSSPAV